YDWFQLGIGIFGVIALFLIFFALVAIVVLRKKKSAKEIKIEVKILNKLYAENKNKILQNILESDEYKKFSKQEAENLKKIKKEKKENKEKKRIFVLDFIGDVAASCLPVFREHVTAVLQVARPTDEIMLRLESPGGYVHAYGLAASQLARIREKQIPLTICVDKVAASGGYMMACLADKIIAAPFSILGSVGVVANVPNFNRVLQKNNVDYLEMTAGEYKRTLTMLGEVTEKGKNKFQEQLEETHGLFKDHIKKYRPLIDIEAVATGEYWLGVKAIEHKLVDELKTSDDYLVCASESCQIIQIYTPKKESFREKLMGTASLFLSTAHHKKMELEKNYPLFM
ncbi:MAG: protease SohB, partial [Bdellovibrionota bacterium]